MPERIVFFCIPAHGHTNPTLGVVRELVGRGHEVWYYSYEPFREAIEKAGAKFVACDTYDAQHNLKPSDGARVAKDLAFATRLLVDTTLALGEKVEEELKQLKPSCIVADSMAVWGKAIAMKQNIPFVSSTTTFAFNRYSAQTMKQGFGKMLKMIFAMPKIQKDLKRLQVKGYPIRNVLDIIQNDENTPTVVYTSPLFQPFADTFTDRYAFVGPILRPAAETVEKEREKLVYISMGTVNNDLLPFYRNCIEALKDAPYQVMMSVGDQIDLEKLPPLPVHITVCRRVDQIAVLEKADAFLTHCGMNSTSEGLYHGVPLVLYPQTAEQNAVAVRTAELGAGVKLADDDPASIRQAIDDVLTDTAFRQNAEKIARSFRECGGAKAAADHILSMCK